MPRWLSSVLTRVRGLAGQGKVCFTLKAIRELSNLGLGLDADDAVEIISRLTRVDSAGRLLSACTGEWLYVFKPRVEGITVYLKMVLRRDCIVVSFHEDGEGDHVVEES